MSLTGVPATAGFAAKFVVILSAIRADHMVLAVLAVACSVVSAFFYMRVAVFMYMQTPREPAPSRLPAPVLAPLVAAALVTLLGGLLPGSLARWAVSP
jgi:NADH-quinone oxidoreductase subunit N